MSDSDTLSWIRDLARQKEIVFVVGKPWDHCEWLPFVWPRTETTQQELRVTVLKARTLDSKALDCQVPSTKKSDQ